MKVPPFLKKGDKIGIVAPASSISASLAPAQALLNTWGLEVVFGESVTAVHHQFAGDDESRRADLQRMLDDDQIKAIFAARGGYGTVRIIDQLDFSRFKEHPKWIIGFSDITVLHSHIQALYQIPTLHGQMPLLVPEATSLSLVTLRKALFGQPYTISYTCTTKHRPGSAEGVLVGGNLAMLVSVSGSVSEVDYRDKILFIEEVGEYYYAVDRMLWMLKRAGKLKVLKGLILGGFTAMKDKAVPFGTSVQEMVLELVKDYDYPVATEFPAGHIENNQALVFGKSVTLSIQDRIVTLTS